MLKNFKILSAIILNRYNLKLFPAEMAFQHQISRSSPGTFKLSSISKSSLSQNWRNAPSKLVHFSVPKIDIPGWHWRCKTSRDVRLWISIWLV